MPNPAALARATSRASADTSVSHTSTVPRGISKASDSPIAPLPVPRSAQRSGRSATRPASPASSRAALDHQLGLRPRDEHPPVDHQVEATERPVAEDVLERLTRAPAGEHRVEMGEGALGGRRRAGLRRTPPERSAGLLAQPPRLGPTVQHAAVSSHRLRQVMASSWLPSLTRRRLRPQPRPLSWRARSSAVRASTTSSRSPASTSCRR